MKPNDKTFFERSIESESPPMRPWFEVDWATERDLIFAVGCPNKPHNPRADAHPDTFTSGLWQHDVGELFIKHAEDDRYLEINLGPRGSWWACLLGCYRQPAGDPEQAPFVPKSIASEITETSWETRLTIPAEFLQTASVSSSVLPMHGTISHGHHCRMIRRTSTMWKTLCRSVSLACRDSS